MNHAMQARCGPPSGFSAVSRAPQTLPFAYTTCCIRVSFESGRETTSLGEGCGGLNTSRQQPGAAIGRGLGSLRQWPCGAFPPGAPPEPGCVCLGGSAYVSEPTSLLSRLRAG